MALVTCSRCSSRYDDESRWTICPHNRIDVRPDTMLCRHCDVYLGYTNLMTRTGDIDTCSICGRTREQLEAEARAASDPREAQ
jgi:rubredoxin